MMNFFTLTSCSSLRQEPLAEAMMVIFVLLAVTLHLIQFATPTYSGPDSTYVLPTSTFGHREKIVSSGMCVIRRQSRLYSRVLCASLCLRISIFQFLRDPAKFLPPSQRHLYDTRIGTTRSVNSFLMLYFHI